MRGWHAVETGGNRLELPRDSYVLIETDFPAATIFWVRDGGKAIAPGVRFRKGVCPELIG